MPSWMLRDQALAARGLLVRRAGGPPVKPYQPPGVWEEATFGTRKYQQDTGDALYRRSLYVFWRRIIGPTTFFDTPGRQVCWVQQSRTNTPLHALVTLNDTTYVEAARALAQRVLTEAGPGSRERVTLAFRLVLTRGPSPDATSRPTVVTPLSSTRSRAVTTCTGHTGASRICTWPSRNAFTSPSVSTRGSWRALSPASRSMS